MNPWKIPSSWEWTTVGEIAHIIGGGTPRSDRPDFYGGNVPWVTPADLSGYTAKMISRGKRNITSAGLTNSSAKLMPADAVLFSSRAPIGYVAIAANPLATNQGFKSLLLAEGISADYIYYYLQRAKELAIERASGTTFLEISGKKMAQIPVPIAPAAEQKRIVAEIEKQFTRLDAGLASLGRINGALKNLRASIIEAACTGRLFRTDQSHPRDPSDSGEEFLQGILSDRPEAFERRMRKYRDAIPPETAPSAVPDGWACASWDQLSVWITYGFTRPMPHTNRGVPIVTAKNVLNGRIDLASTQKTPTASFNALSPKDRPKQHDLLLTKDGTIGRSAVVQFQEDFCINQSVAVIWPSSSRLNASFLRLAIESPTTQRQIRAKARGVALQHLSITDFAKMFCLLPGSIEQERITAECERQLTLGQQLQETVVANKQRAKQLRRALLEQAFAGSLTLQDPNDEPASTLLQRVKIEQKLRPLAKVIPPRSEDRSMTIEPTSTVRQMIERLDRLGGSAAPERLLVSCGLGENVEAFFDLLRSARKEGLLDVPTGHSGKIRKRRDAH
jgi:type I restriction enzyme S subunit